LGGLEPLDVRGSGQVLDQTEVEAMCQAVAGDIIGRVVDQEAGGIHASENGAEIGTDASVIADYLGEETTRFDGLDVIASNHGDTIAMRADNQRGLPGQLKGGDQLHGRVTAHRRLTHEDEPSVGSLLGQERRGLVEFLGINGGLRRYGRSFRLGALLQLNA